MADELKAHLDNARYGTPLLKPEEQTRYLGTFRERCYVSVTVTQAKKETIRSLLSKHIKDFPKATLLINGQLPEQLQASIIQLVTATPVPFTIVATSEPLQPDTLALLLVAKVAVNEDVIDIEKKFTLVETTPAPVVKEKQSFWSRLFR